MVSPDFCRSLAGSATILLLAASSLAATTLDCTKIRADGKSFNFKSIGGPHSVFDIDESNPTSVTNWTWTVDLCANLKRDKGVKSGNFCEPGTRVCGIESLRNRAEKTSQIMSVVPVAGSFPLSHGGNINTKTERIIRPETAKPGTAGGVRLTLHGGRYGKGKDARDQMAIIEMKCDLDRTGNEGNEGAKDKVDAEERRRRRMEKRKEAASDDDDKEEDEGDDDEEIEQPDPNNSLKFISYKEEDTAKTDVLRLEWWTKSACLDPKDDDLGDGSSGWGFFTWLILLAFMGTAAYLIFGSWLNYNRYGARGWDLLPHGDTIRDVPYLFRDWTRKVIDTIQGGHSRAGYSAV